MAVLERVLERGCGREIRRDVSPGHSPATPKQWELGELSWRGGLEKPAGEAGCSKGYLALMMLQGEK